jgi:hypothetical protein
MYTPRILTSAPTAKAGINRTANPGTTVKMNGSASSDPNGLPLTYQWSFISIPAGSGASILGAASVQPTFIPDRAGNYVLQLVVNNGTQNSVPSQVVIVTPNLPPVASAGGNQAVNVGALVFLNGSASSDPNNDPLTYQWSMLSQPAGSSAVLANSFSATPSFVADRVGVYVATLTVTDPSGASASATVSIVSNAQPPVANAGANQIVNVADTAVLSGATSTDPNGYALSYKWSFVSQPPSSSATLQNAASNSPSFVADRVGTYVAQLVVNNGYFDSAPATVSIAAQDVPPGANAGMNQVVNSRSVVHLDGSGSTDLGGNPLTYQWSLNVPAGSSAVLSDATLVNPMFQVDVPGDYVAQLVVNDGFLSSAPASVTISTVVAAPTANAGFDQTVNPGDTVLLDGSGSSDPGGLPLTYAWSFVSVPAGTAAALSDPASVQPTFVVDRAGTYVVQLIVNNSFLTSAPSTVTITTNNVAPIANAGANQTVLMGSTVTLSGAASTDANGDPLTYTWSLITLPPGSAAVLSNPTSVTPSFVADQPGTFVAQLIVNDGSLNGVPATVMITTNAVAPVASAGPNQTVDVGSTVNLDGSGSTDANSLPLTYHWSLTSVPAGSAAALTDPGAVQPSFNADLGGIYVAQLIVNNGLLNSAPATVTITTNNSPPTANAGPDQQVNVGGLVTLDGSGSTDPNGYPLTYSWAFLSMPEGSTSNLSSANAMNPTFVADMTGSYVAQLIVRDPLFSSLPSTLKISTTNIGPIANAGLNQSVSRRAKVTLDGTGSTGPSGHQLSYKWSFTTLPDKSSANLSNSTAAQPTFVADRSGTYLVQLIVNDGIQKSSPATVTVNAR